MRIYISGPITNDPDYYKKFEKVAYELVEMGHKVINPAELINVMPEDATHKEYMDICISLLRLADVVVMLPEWTTSQGAFLELQYANMAGIKILTYESMKTNELLNDKYKELHILREKVKSFQMQKQMEHMEEEQ